MSDTSTFGLPQAAHRLGVSVRALRQAIRTGKVPAPVELTATTPLSVEWLEGVQAAVEQSPALLSRSFQQAVPPFARYAGTSAWRKYPNRVREYAHYRAAAR